MRVNLSFEHWDEEMEKGANFTTHIVHGLALIRIPSYSGAKHCHWI